MHFSIPETVQASEENGSKFWNFHIHVNGVFHCKLRYSQLDKFYEQLKNDFPGRIQSRLFPGKKLFSLSPDQLEERRDMLEKFIQHISQDPVIGVSDQFNDFFVKAQQAGLDIPSENVSLDVFLMNGNKVTLEISTTDQTDDVLEAAMTKIGLQEKFYYYFALFFVRKEDNGGGIRIVRKLQDFESPYLSLKAVTKPHRIIIRKNYWSPSYDDDLLEDRIAMNLLYVQITDDLDRGWMLCSDEQKKRMKKLQNQGSRKDVLRLARDFKFYGFLHYSPCTSDYPDPDSSALIASGDRELNIRVSKENDTKVMEGRFKVQRIRSWRLTSLPGDDDASKEKLQFAFEYLFGKDELRWVTIESDQAIMMSMALQGIVDEILREKRGQGIRLPRKKEKKDPNDTSSSSISGQSSNSTDKKSKRSDKNKGIGVNEDFAAGNIGDDDL
ncbi:sorting nexin-17-like isoform X2 [Clytia hemisphaerica]|uniref:sorting nexin-17-like isoform X2 n=1 Tax=Clytia hemisphaerica TaxID=252671 RepID=UPI0034D683FD